MLNPTERELAIYALRHTLLRDAIQLGHVTEYITQEIESFLDWEIEVMIEDIYNATSEMEVSDAPRARIVCDFKEYLEQALTSRDDA